MGKRGVNDLLEVCMYQQNVQFGTAVTAAKLKE